MLTALAIAGPTASGKSDMACAVAKAVNGEVISVDAGGVYREMDIGTAKPSLEWRRQVRHHLFDIRNPNERFDAGAFCRLAVAAAEDISARGKVPVLAGGTMMYFYLLHRQMHNIPPVAACVRAQVEEEIDKRGTRQTLVRIAYQKDDGALAAAIPAKVLPCRYPSPDIRRRHQHLSLRHSPLWQRHKPYRFCRWRWARQLPAQSA